MIAKNRSAPISIERLTKLFPNKTKALDEINLRIEEGEIFALLGPNGAGKTTLINIICGLTKATYGEILVRGYHIENDFRKARQLIGLVPQELHTDMFERVWDTVSFSRGIFGLPKNPSYISEILRDLNLWEKRKDMIATLSGGMKRRVLIAKALSHEPKILFLDEPTAGVDVKLRQDMWNLVRSYRDRGVTVILTTHFIDEAEELADRVGVIDQGKIVVIEEKNSLLARLGKKMLRLHLGVPLTTTPRPLKKFNLTVTESGSVIEFLLDDTNKDCNFWSLFEEIKKLEIKVTGIETKQSSLEDIFVKLLDRNNV